MNHRHKLFLNGLIGLIVIAVTLVVFFFGFSVNIQKQTIDYLALLFVLTSEVVLFGVMMVLIANKNSGDQIFLHSGLMSTLTIYWLVTTMVSIFVNPVFKGNLFSFITVQVMILGITAIIVISIILSALNIRNQNTKTSDSGMILQDCEAMMYSLLNNKQYQNLDGQLKNIYELLKFSDKSVCLTEQENVIRLKINELSDGIKASPLDETVIIEVTNKLDNIIGLIKARNMAVKQSKGGYI